MLAVVVSKNHIKEGLPKSPYACPIALALREQGYKHSDIAVSSINLYVKPHFYTLPSEAVSFIHYFDKNQNGEPFEFEIDLDNPARTIEND